MVAPKLVAVLLLGGLAIAQPPQQYPQQPYPPQQQYPGPQGYPAGQQPYPQQPQQQQEPEDPDAQNHGAARISLMNGDVSVRRGDNGEYLAAVINAPLVVGDRVLTGPNGRAEVQLDASNFVRVGPNSEIRLAELAYHRYQIQLARGTAMFRVLRPSNSDVEVSTPQASIRPKNVGAYRILVRDDGESEITVRLGEVEVFTPRGAENLKAGQMMMMRGTASEPEFQIVGAGGEDEWDRWNHDRDGVLLRSVSGRYVNPDVYGTEDLDAYGRWVPDSNYGQVWAPTVPPGWAPYRAGRWVWVDDYYGWTWVSYDPWGWAPYHYGSWFLSAGYGWCWYPGGIGFGYRHFWSPARVAFVGFGPGVAGIGVGFGFGSVGWFPLAPFERFHPWWGRGFGGGYRGMTVVNNINVYRNARVTNGVTTVTREGFTGGAAGRAFTGDIRTASMVHGQLPTAVGRASTSFTNRAPASSTFARASTNQSFFSTRGATQVNRGTFGQSPSQVNRGAFGQGAPQVNRGGFGQGAPLGTQGSQGPAGGQNGWRRFGQPNSGTPSAAFGRGNPAPAPQARANVSPTNRGFGGFGDPAARPAPNYQNRPAAPNYAAGPVSRQGGFDRGPSSAGGGSVRINPPVVRERPSASAPRMQAAPAPHAQPAPRPSGGGGSYGGGGGSHSSGGGGGGHNGGGGGHRGR